MIGFSYPVVPQGKARIRVQVSAAHTPEELEYAAEQFAASKRELGICWSRLGTGGSLCRHSFQGHHIEWSESKFVAVTGSK